MNKIVISYQGVVETIDNLPITGNILGDFYTVKHTGIQYFWSRNNSTGGISDWHVVNGPEITQEEKDNLELDLAKVLVEISCFNTYTYVGDALTLLEIYTDNTLTNKLFSKAFTYTGDELTQMVLTRISDSAILTSVYAYSSGNLISVTKT